MKYIYLKVLFKDTSKLRVENKFQNNLPCLKKMQNIKQIKKKVVLKKKERVPKFKKGPVHEITNKPLF